MQDNKIKNLVSVIIILAGVLLGALLIDVAQFFSQSGYSERALKDAEIFTLGEKTWVAYEEPKVEVQVLSVSEEELEECPTCNPEELLTQINQVVPTLVAKKVLASSEEGKKMVEDYKIKTLPAFVFDKKIEDTNFYGQPGVESLFEEKDGRYLLNTTALGLPAGKYLELPEIDGEKYAVLGSEDGKAEIIVYSDYQCPYSKMFYDIVKETVENNPEQVSLIYKDLPLDFHPQSNNSAMAAACAQEQGKFWEMSDQLYENQEEWSAEEGKEIFQNYAQAINLDMQQYNQCMEEEKYKEKIEADKKEAGEFGISGTPSGFVGSQFLGGVVKKEELEKMIDTVLSENNQEENGAADEATDGEDTPAEEANAEEKNSDN